MVHGGPHEHTSILKMIEWRWGLEPRTTRDRKDRNLVEVLNFEGVNHTSDAEMAAPATFVRPACGVGHGPLDALQSTCAPQVMLRAVAVMVRARSEAAKAATLPTSSRVAARFSIVRRSVASIMASRPSKSSGSESTMPPVSRRSPA